MSTTATPIAAPIDSSGGPRAYGRRYWVFAVPAAMVVLLVILFPWIFTLFMSVHEWKVTGDTPFVGLASQTSFMQGRAAFWWDGIGFSAPLLDKTKSRISEKVGFAPVPAGPKAHNACTFIDGIGIPANAKNKKAAWMFVQWITGKPMQNEQLRSGSGTPARLSCYGREDIVKGSAFPQEWFDTTSISLKIARSGLPVIVPVTEFRDTIGTGLTNIVGGADVATELKKATAAFQPVLDKSNEA